MHLLQESQQVPIDLVGCLFMTEMPCAGNGYVAAVRGIALCALDGIGQHVGIGVTA